MDPYACYLLALHLAFAMPSAPPVIFSPPGVPSPSAPGAVHAVASATPATPGAVHIAPSPSPATPAVIHAPPLAVGGAYQVLIGGDLTPLDAVGLVLRPAGLVAGRPAYSTTGSANLSGAGAIIQWAEFDNKWVFAWAANDTPSFPGTDYGIWESAENVATPELVTAWTPAETGVLGSPVMDWVSGSYARATLDPADTNNAIAVQAVAIGPGGNNISVAIAAPAAQAATTVGVSGDAITITPGAKGVMTLAAAGAHTDSYGDARALDGLRFYEETVDSGRPTWWQYSSHNPDLVIGNYSTIRWTGALWEILVADPGGYVFRAYSAQDVATPDLVTAWTTDTSGAYALCSGTVDALTAGVSPAQHAVDALRAQPGLDLVLDVANAAGNDGTGALAPVAQTYLSGGALGGSLTPPPAIHSAPARTPGTPPAIYTP